MDRGCKKAIEDATLIILILACIITAIANIVTM